VLGFRKGEALGLIWPEGDEEWPRDGDSAEIALEWQVQHVGGNGLTHKQRLKADGSTDSLPLPPIGVAALRLAKRNQDKARTAAWPKKCVCGQPHTLALTTRTGLPLSPRNVNRWFDARCKRYGVRRITVHDTRRTCGSLLAALDVHPRVAMAILRHSRMAMAMEIYTQVPDKATRDALRRLSAELDDQSRHGSRGRRRRPGRRRRRGWLGPCCRTLLLYSPESGAERVADPRQRTRLRPVGCWSGPRSSLSQRARSEGLEPPTF
jgi:integrase